MDKLADILKPFIEKYMVSSVISIAGAIVTILYIPDNHWALLKLGKTPLMVLAFCIYFLIVLCVKKIGIITHNMFIRFYRRRYTQLTKEQQNKDTINAINKYIDSLSPDDKDTLLTFIHNGNKTLIDCEKYYFQTNIYSNSNFMLSSNYYGELSTLDLDKYWISPSLVNVLDKGMRPVGVLKQYKLNDDFFNDLTILYKMQGKIGNF